MLPLGAGGAVAAGLATPLGARTMVVMWLSAVRYPEHDIATETLALARMVLGLVVVMLTRLPLGIVAGAQA